MNSLDTYLKDYARAHRHPVNQLTHKIAIPMIVFSSVAMIDWLPYGIGVGIYGLIAAWYVWLAKWDGALTAAVFGVCLLAGRATPPWIVGSLFIAGWIIQLAGHALWEKNHPAFVQNLEQTLIGPLFFLKKLTAGKAKTAPASAGRPLAHAP